MEQQQMEQCHEKEREGQEEQEEEQQQEEDGTTQQQEMDGSTPQQGVDGTTHQQGVVDETVVDKTVVDETANEDQVEAEQQSLQKKLFMQEGRAKVDLHGEETDREQDAEADRDGSLPVVEGVSESWKANDRSLNDHLSAGAATDSDEVRSWLAGRDALAAKLDSRFASEANDDEADEAPPTAHSNSGSKRYVEERCAGPDESTKEGKKEGKKEGAGRDTVERQQREERDFKAWKLRGELQKKKEREGWREREERKQEEEREQRELKAVEAMEAMAREALAEERRAAAKVQQIELDAKTDRLRAQLAAARAAAAARVEAAREKAEVQRRLLDLAEAEREVGGRRQLEWIVVVVAAVVLVLVVVAATVVLVLIVANTVVLVVDGCVVFDEYVLDRV
jgi:hypothetical protein